MSKFLEVTTAIGTKVSICKDDISVVSENNNPELKSQNVNCTVILKNGNQIGCITTYSEIIDSNL